MDEINIINKNHKDQLDKLKTEKEVKKMMNFNK